MKVKTATIIRTIILFVTLINQTLVFFGKNPLPFSDEDLYGILSTVITIGATIWAWWKNNSFTSAAILSDELMHEIKNEGTEITYDQEEKEVE